MWPEQAVREGTPRCSCSGTGDLILNLCSDFVAQKTPNILELFPFVSFG